jgi:putative peptidoglycan lipid II flippase
MALTGTLISSLLVPPLVRLVDAGDRRATERLAGAFLGTALLVFGAAAVLVVVAAPLVLQVLTLGVDDVDQAAGQRAAGRLLLLLCMPQLLLYAVAGTCEAVMNAHGRFALPSAAPTSENVGVILTMSATAIIYGTGSAGDVSTGQLVLMAVGSTVSVATHAGIQWWGVRRVGVRLVPRAGWHEPAVREIVHKAVPSLGYSGLDVAQRFGFVVVANRVPGGVVAFDLAINFYVLPWALGARPMAVALLPQLSRLSAGRQMTRFRDELVRGASLMLFFAVPAAVAFAVLAGPIARGVTFGAMAASDGQVLLRYALLGLSAGVVGECSMLLATYASYARGDVRSPLLAMVVRLAVAAAGIGIAVGSPAGPGGLLILALAVSAADLAGAAFLAGRLRAALPRGGERLLPALLRATAAAAVTAVVAVALAALVPSLVPRGGDQAAIVVACLVGASVFLLVQALLRSPELRLLRGVLRRRGVDGA